MNPNLNSENPDNNNQDPTNMSDEEKKSYMINYVRSFRITSNPDDFERLLGSGVSPNITSPEGKSLLMIASEKGSIELVQVLLDAGAEVEFRDHYGKTALFYAVEVANENTDVISALIARGADPNGKSVEGKTPLIRAVEKGHSKIAKTLLSKNGNIYVTVDNTGDTLLHLAAKQEDASMVQMLLAHNADPNRKNKKNQLALDVCQNGGHVMQIIQSAYPKQKPPAQTPEPQANMNQQTTNINAQIHEFLQIQSQQQNQQFEQQGKPNDELGQFRQDNAQQGQDQNADNSKSQQKQPLQDYRRHQQQQQLNQKKSPQPFPQKVEKEPPTRKYPGKTDTSMRRTVSSNEGATTDSSNRMNENMANSGMNPMTANYTLEHPQNPYDLSQNYNMAPGLEPLGEDIPERQIDPRYVNRPHEHGKSPEHNPGQYQYQNQNRQQQQQQNKKMNIPGASSASDICSTSTSTTERFQERDIPPNIIKTPQGEFMQQYHPQQQQQQVQGAYMGNPPQMGQMGYNPVQQMKGNVSPNMYANPQFFNASPNPNNNQAPYQKRKPKGQMNMPNANNKNFPMNNNPNNPNNPNQGGPNQLPNMNQNQYNRGGNMPPNMEGVRPDQGFQQQQQPQPQRGPGNQQSGNKFNKNAERNFQQDNAMQQQQQQRGFPPGYQQHPNMNMPPGNMPPPPEVGDVQKMPGEGIVKMPVSARGVEDGGKDQQKGGRPQQQQYHHQQQGGQQGQQQGNMMFSNNSGAIMFNPNFMMGPGMMGGNMSNMPGQNQMMFNANFPQGQPGNMNMMNSQNMPPQNNFINYSPGMSSRGQQMMPKGQMMQPPYNYANGVQMNNSMDPKVVHLNMNEPLQVDNMRLSANVHSILKGISDQIKETDKMKNENTDLKANLEEIQQNEKALQEKLREKERLIEELRRKTEDLELTAKTISSKSPLVNRQDSSVITDGLLDNFLSTPFEKILQEPKPKADFWKHDDLVGALHEEVLAFEKSVDNYNTEKKNLFDSLITMIRQTVAEVVTETEFYIYGSFATGLSLPWSDIDIVIKMPQLYYNGYAAILDSIEQNLKKKKWVDDIKIIKNTSVPVLKITCSKSTYTSKKVDISLQDTRHNGLACVELVREYLTFYPALRPLVLILKQFLYRLNLNDTYSGGLSSYGLILMVVYLFQTREMQNSMTPVENQNLGSLLLSFLYFYGFEFDYYNQFLVNPKKIPKGNEIIDSFAENMSVINLVNQNPPSIMEPKIIIQDPLSLANNVGRSTFQIKQIKNAFMAAYFEAYKPCICEVHKFIGEIDSIDGKKPVHKCASIFRRMMLSLQPLK